MNINGYTEKTNSCLLACSLFKWKTTATTATAKPSRADSNCQWCIWKRIYADVMVPSFRCTTESLEEILRQSEKSFFPCRFHSALEACIICFLVRCAAPHRLHIFFSPSLAYRIVCAFAISGCNTWGWKAALFLLKCIVFLRSIICVCNVHCALCVCENICVCLKCDVVRVELEIISCACINGFEFSACKMRHRVYVQCAQCRTTINAMMVAFNKKKFSFSFLLQTIQIDDGAFGVFDFTEKERRVHEMHFSFRRVVTVRVRWI